MVRVSTEVGLGTFMSLLLQAVTVWDLHVGAEVDILGRMTTLHLGVVEMDELSVYIYIYVCV